MEFETSTYPFLFGISHTPARRTSRHLKVQDCLPFHAHTKQCINTSLDRLCNKIEHAANRFRHLIHSFSVTVAFPPPNDALHAGTVGGQASIGGRGGTLHGCMQPTLQMNGLERCLGIANGTRWTRAHVLQGGNPAGRQSYTRAITAVNTVKTAAWSKPLRMLLLCHGK